MRKVRWGVVGVARIATDKVIPAMQGGDLCEIVAIASRDGARAESAASRLGIPKAYASYEALLADPDIDAVYNPLPNHLHVPVSEAAALRGKHVLCEKPIGMTAVEARHLINVRNRTGVKIEEAFMVRTHPQWLAVQELCASGRIGNVRSYAGLFSYFNDDQNNIRNIAAYGGGGLMDIGCYLTVTARMVFGEEPRRVFGLVERDPDSQVDTLASILLDFPSGHATGTCSTRLVPHQRVQILGTDGRIEVEIPFNAPPDRACRLFVDDGSDLTGAGIETITLPVCDQYRIQGDAFARAILDDTDVPYPLEMSVRNMEILEAVVRSAESGRWEVL